MVVMDLVTSPADRSDTLHFRPISLARAIDHSKSTGNHVADLCDHRKSLERTFVLHPLMGSMLLAVPDLQRGAHGHIIDDMYTVTFTASTFQRVGAAIC